MKRKRASGRRKPKLGAKKAASDSDSPNTRDDLCGDDFDDAEFDSRMNTETPQNGGRMTRQQAANLSKKARSEMTASRGVASSSVKPIGDAEEVLGEGAHQKDPNSSHQNPQYKAQELKASLSVIREVMKMDAAEPFNAPVDPIALGIPDYFDVIDTPMDFGTICSNLENGVKYKNSKDVWRHVQYIWDNCCKYNRKGHYILELMKRVKRNFTKYWEEAGLYRDQEQEIDGHPHLSPTKSVSRCGMHGCRTPLDSMAEYARQQQQDQVDLSRIRSYQTQQRPSERQLSSGRQQTSRPQVGKNVINAEATKRWSSCEHGCAMDPMGENITHSQQNQKGRSHFQLKQNQHSLSHSQPYQPQERSRLSHSQPYPPQERSRLSHSQPYQPQERSHQCQSNSQKEPSCEDCNMFIANAGYAHLPPPIGSTMRESPHGHRCTVAPTTDNSTCLRMNHIGLSQQLHQHGPSVSYSQQYQHQEGSFECHLGCGQLHTPESLARTDTADAGKFSVLPPEESMIRSRKRGPRSPVGLRNDFISQQQDEMATSHVQCHQSEQGTCQGQGHAHCGQAETSQPEDDVDMGSGEGNFYSSPAVESMIKCTKRGTKYPAVPMTDFISQQQDQTTPSQMQSRQPQQETSLGCMSSRQPQPSQPLAPVDMGTADSSSIRRRTRGRGPTRCLHVWNGKGKISIATNEFGQPIGPEAPKLTNFLGTIARDGHIAPLNYVDWRALPEENKEMMWQHVQSKFDIDPNSKSWVLKSIGNKWKNWKAQLKSSHYNPHETDEERLADRDDRVLPDQWQILVSFWSSKEAQERSATNKTNRSKQKTCHTTGTKSFARVREEQRAKRPDGKEPSRAELFILTRTRKDGRPVNEASSTLISQLQERATQQQGASQNHTVDDEVFFQVVGEDRHGRVRTYGLGPAPSDLGVPKPNRVEALRMVSEANAEVREMKERMASMEQTCAQMAAQMATMMSMMSNMQNTLPEKHLPNVVRGSPSTNVHADQVADISSNSGGSQQIQINSSSPPRSEVRRGKKQRAGVGKVSRKKR